MSDTGLSWEQRKIINLLKGYNRPVRLANFITRNMTKLGYTIDRPGKEVVNNFIKELIDQGFLIKETRGHNAYIYLSDGNNKKTVQSKPLTEVKPILRKRTSTLPQTSGVINKSLGSVVDQWNELRSKDEELDMQLEALIAKKASLRKQRHEIDEYILTMRKKMLSPLF